MSEPVITVGQMRKWEEQSWAAGRNEDNVIARVGQLLAQRALRMSQPDDRILILAGKGHNGDDARLAQAHLVGRKVRLLSVADPAAQLPELEGALLKKPALVIDGLFGIGLNRALSPAWIRFVETLNKEGLPVLAVDVPSGLNADTGETEGAAVRATVTLTLAAPKRGLLAAGSWPHVGRLELANDIGLIPCPFDSELRWTMPEDFGRIPPPRPVAGHKGTFGHLAILAGSRGYHGAAVLAARGALRACPGLVSLFTPENVYLPVASQLESAMVHTWPPGATLPSSLSAWVVGPGLAAADLPPEMRAWVNDLWAESPVPVVADASALGWLRPGLVNSRAPRVITPHPGEAARLLEWKPGDLQENRPKALRELSEQFGNCWVVLKGHQTLVGRKNGAIWINPSGNPMLAQGGSGDVLAGFLGGLLAQKGLADDIGLALRHGVWRHGCAADTLSQKMGSWTIPDLVASLLLKET